MPLLSNQSEATTRFRLKPTCTQWVAVLLPLALTTSCASRFDQGNVIDYTVSEAEYLATTQAPQPQEPRLAAALPDTTGEAESDKAMMLAKAPEPSMAAAQAKAKAPQMIDKVMTDKAIADADNSTHTTAATPANKNVAPKLAAAFDERSFLDKADFTRSIYSTAGLGVSRLDPDTSAAPDFNPNDRVVGGGQVAIGVDVAKHLSFELHSADLGSAGLSPQGRVNYHLNGISALFYAGKNAGRFGRRGFNGFARVGINQLENTPVGDVPFIDQTSQQASFGLGAEYNTRSGLGVRADVIAYDGDVQYGQLGLLYRLGQKPASLAIAKAEALSKAEENAVAMTKTEEAQPQLAAAKDSMKAAEKPLMIERLGAPLAAHEPVTHEPVTDTTIMHVTAAHEPMMAKTAASDEVSFTEVTEMVADRCSDLNGTLNDVRFNAGSADMTSGSTIALNRIARTLVGCSDRQLVIAAHTDNEGSAEANHQLSINRARAVAEILNRRGVSAGRIRAVAYGESQPIASNATIRGRMQNRRVELTVQ